MEDKEFIELLTLLAETPYGVESEAYLDMTPEQSDIADAVATCAYVAGSFNPHLGGSATGRGAIEVRKRFSNIFDKNGHAIGMGGKKKRGDKGHSDTEDKALKVRDLMKTIDPETGVPYSHRKACIEMDINTKTQRDAIKRIEKKESDPSGHHWPRPKSDNKQRGGG